MYTYGYAWEKFGRAIYTLAVSSGDIRKRLLLVFQGDLLCITPEHLPESIRSEYAWVMERITKYDESYKGQRDHLHSITAGNAKRDYLLPGKVEASIKRMRCSTATKVADIIFKTWEHLEEEFQRGNAEK